MLHIVASTVNKRVAGGYQGIYYTGRVLIVTRGFLDLGSFVDERLPEFWKEYIENNEVPAAARKNALTAWLWVWALAMKPNGGLFG